eukprot:COSAG05_NODE_6166_length_1010_cov_1.135016_1_plen_197_part_10
MALADAAAAGQWVRVGQLVEAARDKDSEGWLPLHSAVYNFDALAQAFVAHERARLESRDKAVRDAPPPLGLSSWGTAAADLVGRFIDSFPEAVHEREADGGRLPLHLALVARAASTLVERLLRDFPDAVREPTKFGDLPLHLAASYDSAPEVVAKLLEACRGKHKLQLASYVNLSRSDPCVALTTEFPHRGGGPARQ